jgi:hypothetical protein
LFLKHYKMSDHESNDGRGNRVGATDEEELASKTLQIQSKRFYLDVKQNKRGRFIKVAEVDAAGRKSRLLFAMSSAAEFRDKLTEFSEHYASLGPHSKGSSQSGGSGDDTKKLKSDVITKDDRRYYMDLKENKRGRFLKVSMTFPLSRQRFQVLIPAQGMIEIRDGLSDLLNEFGTDDHEDLKENLPEAKSLRADNRMFYFDIGQNKRGTFLRISEVSANFRSSVTIPEQSWLRMRDIMDEYVKHSESAGTKATMDDAAGEPTAPGGPTAAGVVAPSSESGDAK